jgi:hypothetical protein
MTLIDGQQYTLLRDYDKGKYHFLTFKGKITYLRNRVEFILLNPCKSAMANATQSNLGLVLTTATCAGISAASTFLKGKRAQKKGDDRKFFIAFVNQYMDSRLQKPISSLKVTWADWLYADLRCGLAHNFTICRGGIEESTNYLEETVHGPEICPLRLLEDLAAGWSKYLDDVERDGPSKGLGRLFQNRFDKVFQD